MTGRLDLQRVLIPVLPTGVSPGVTVRSYIPYVNLIYGDVINVLPVLLIVLRW
jgi:hypothetical protein